MQHHKVAWETLSVTEGLLPVDRYTRHGRPHQINDLSDRSVLVNC